MRNLSEANRFRILRDSATRFQKKAPDQATQNQSQWHRFGVFDQACKVFSAFPGLESKDQQKESWSCLSVGPVPR